MVAAQRVRDLVHGSIGILRGPAGNARPREGLATHRSTRPLGRNQAIDKLAVTVFPRRAQIGKLVIGVAGRTQVAPIHHCAVFHRDVVVTLSVSHIHTRAQSFIQELPVIPTETHSPGRVGQREHPAHQ